MIEFGRVTLTRNGSAGKTVTAQVRLTGSEGDDDNAEPMDDVEVVQPFGLSARPTLTAHTEAAGFRAGDEFIPIALLDKSAAPNDLAEGETRLWNQAGAKITTKPDGSIELESSGGAKITLGADGSITVSPGGAASIYLATSASDPTAKNVAAGGDAVSGGTSVTPVASRRVKVPQI